MQMIFFFCVCVCVGGGGVFVLKFGGQKGPALRFSGIFKSQYINFPDFLLEVTTA